MEIESNTINKFQKFVSVEIVCQIAFNVKY